jgi:hypothetical protein
VDHVSLGKVFYRVGQATVILMVLGWAAVVYTALYITGGHPPPSAFVGMAVIMSSWILGSVGALCGVVGILRIGRTWGGVLFVILNLGLLVFAVVVSLM